MEVTDAAAPNTRFSTEEISQRTWATVWLLVLCQAGALVMQVLAVGVARQSGHPAAFGVAACAFALTYASALWFIAAPSLTRAVRNSAVACLGVTTAIQGRLADPIVLSGFDEQLHLRTLRDILLSHSLFEPNPILAVSPYYPGMESLTSVIHQLGLPIGASTLAIVVVARLVLVLALCDAVEHFTGSMRAGGLAVAVYAISSQFVWFNSQFAYQTLALPLALAAIALIARVRSSAHPGLHMAGAAVCLCAVAMTHHVTSFVTALFLVVWTATERNAHARRQVLYGALIALSMTGVWATLQWPVLEGYFVPMIDDIFSQVTGGMRRAAFTDGSGTTTPLWQRCMIIFYAASVSLATAWIALRYLRSAPRQQRLRMAWEPRALLILLSAMIPVLFAARTLPSGAEISDRSSGFLFLPFSALVAESAVIYWRTQRARTSQPWPVRNALLTRIAAASLATTAFVGGYLAGSGPDWARLPGAYLVASNRSMDAETLAAVRWAGDALPDGSRIGADSVSALLLASEAGLWPMPHDVAQLYFSNEWGDVETTHAKSVDLRYLFVDRRLANDLPHVGWYFFEGETDQPQRLTTDQLAKFDTADGVSEVYRHGPISIYDLGPLGIPASPTGWVGERPAPPKPVQIAIGLAIGLAMAAGSHTRRLPSVNAIGRHFLSAAGPILTFAVSVSLLSVVSVTLLLLGAWPTPVMFGGAVIVLLLANTRSVRSLCSRRVSSGGFICVTAWLFFAVIVAMAIAQSVAAAARDDIHEVNDILVDRSAIQHPAASTEGTGL